MKTLEDLKVEWGEDRYNKAASRISEELAKAWGWTTVDEMKTINSDAGEMFAAFRNSPLKKIWNAQAEINKTEDLTWTDKIPTGPGWYWVTWANGPETIEMLEIIDAEDKLITCYLGREEPLSAFCEDGGRIFYGPINPPALPGRR